MNLENKIIYFHYCPGCQGKNMGISHPYKRNILYDVSCIVIEPKVFFLVKNKQIYRINTNHIPYIFELEDRMDISILKKYIHTWLEDKTCEIIK